MSRSEEQRALSIRQPWAYAILHLGKDVENRPWRTHYRGRILIQAALKIERKEAAKLKLDLDELPTGAIVGSVEIVDCVRNSKSKWAIRGQWHWKLENPRYLAKPIPFKGALGFIRVPPRLLNGKHFLASNKARI
ncbi:MAG: ASCH domain-containing protein [Candidatus Binataceae bacterium]|nr:ASCH domain-containing protein [Candidatus Binataceae bacterium]